MKNKRISIIAKINMIDEGLIPSFTANELITMLNSLTPEQQRITKRKFRKKWRKVLKKNPSLYAFFVPDIDVETNRRHHIRNRSITVAQIFLSDASKSI